MIFQHPMELALEDYIHIKDICSAIEKSIRFLLNKKKSEIFNIGNYKGLSNQEIVNYINKKIKKKINIKYVNRRKGDISRLVCNSNKARRLLSWKAKNSNLTKIIHDEINWVKKLNKLGIERRFKNYLK